MIRTQLPFDNKTFLIISLSKQSKINIYINQNDSLPTRELDQIITTAHFHLRRLVTHERRRY